MSWSKETSRQRIKDAAKAVEKLEVVKLSREVDLYSIPLEKAYLVDGVHIYVDITNARELLGTTDFEGERCHKRILRFLHLYQRMVHFAFAGTNAFKVDFQNERLHFVVFKPLDDAIARVIRAVALVKLLLDVVSKANEKHEDLPNAKLAVGIDTGLALAVNNGTRSDREPLFIGEPANRAAKVIGKNKEGVFLTPTAAKVLGLQLQPNQSVYPLNPKQMDWCADQAQLGSDVDALVEKWKEELKETPLADIEFSRPTPPLKDLDIDTLTPANSRRSELLTLFADIDGFTKFVSARMGDLKKAAETVRVLHVVRKELRDVLHDHDGLKIRYIGDCLHGVMVVGTSQTTDAPTTVVKAALCAGAMRDAFGLVQEELPAAQELGLAIGLEYGPVSITRLGVKNDRDRCVIGRAVYEAEGRQSSCNGKQTAFGPEAVKAAKDEIGGLLDSNNKAIDLTHTKVELHLQVTEKAQKVAGTMVPLPPNVSLPRPHCR